MDYANFIDSKRKELISNASAILSGDIDMIDGIRRILSLSMTVGDGKNDVFAVLREIDSESDHFPLGDVRLKWNPEALSRMDAEMNYYLSNVKDDILRSCQEILQRYSAA